MTAPLLPRFDAATGLVPAIAQEARTGHVLMLAWMDRAAFDATLATGFAHYHSRSRGRLWKKGEESGHVQRVVGVRLDCDSDAVLLQVEQTGPACHTNAPSCFFDDAATGTRNVGPPPANAADRLMTVLLERATLSEDTSYTAKLLSAGMPKILAKVAEESAELQAALASESDARVVSEAADLLYHVLVGFVQRGLAPDAVYLELARRFGQSGLAEKAARAVPSPTSTDT